MPVTGRRNPCMQTMKDVAKHLNDILNPEGPYPYRWNKIFVALCVLAVGTDPLFFYIPIIHDDKKCVATDDKLKIAALVMRCYTDIFYIADIYYQNRNRSVMAGLTRTLSPYFISIDFIGVIPLPQVIHLFLFSKVRGPRALDIRGFLDILVIAQYVLRIVRMCLSIKELKMMTIKLPGSLVNGLLYLFLYFAAGHVLGSFWYFFSAQRQIGCWQRACRHHGGCVSATFNCNENTLANRTFLNYFCPIDPPDATVFDFGIFLDALQKGVLGPMDFPKKYLQCYWWGLRNLSSFGQNQDASTFAWESWFVILVSVIGLLLFLYLIGTVQTYIQLHTEKSEEARWTLLRLPEIKMVEQFKLPENTKLLLRQQIKRAIVNDKDVELEHLLASLPNGTQEEKQRKAHLELEFRKLANVGSRKKEQEMRLKLLSAQIWMKENEIPEDMRRTFLLHVRYILEDNRDIDLKNMLSILPREDKNRLKKHFCLASINKVLILRSMGIKMRETLISYLKPTVYSENSYIIRKGEPLDLMLFIIQGVVWSFTAYDDNGSNNAFRSFKRLEKGAYYGEEFLNWALTVSDFDSASSLPMSSLNVRCHTKVEALVLTANDLMAFKPKQQWLLGGASLVIQNAWRRHKREESQRMLLIH